MNGIWRKFIFVVLILFIFLSHASAQLLKITSFSVEPNVVWINEGDNIVKVTASCTFNDTKISDTVMRACIKSLNYLRCGDSKKGDTYIYKFKFEFSKYNYPPTGTYDVEVECTYNATNTTYTDLDTKKLDIHELTLNIIKGSEQIETYQGADDFILKVQFKLDGNLITKLQPDTFEVFYKEGDEWREFEQIIEPVVKAKDGYQEIYLYIPLHEDDISIGEHDIKVKATYYGDGGKSTIIKEVKNFFWVNNPMSIDIKDNKVVCPANEICKTNITAKVIFRAGSIEKFDTENVEVVLISKYKYQKVMVDNINCDDNTEECTISVIIPSYISSGDYDLFLTIGYPSLDSYRYKAQDSIPFESVIEISGEFKDAAGKVVSTEIVLENIETGETITSKTDSNGKYSIKLLPGTYNIAFKFNNAVVAKIYNVSITDFELMSIPGNMIRFDSDHIISGLPSGVNMVKIVVLEFALPSSDVWIYIPYDSKKVNGKEENLRVYRCADWNFMKSSCTGEWEQIPANVHTIRDAIEFTTNRSAAFLIGENKWLLFSKLELKDLEVYMGEPVTVDGAVIDNDDNPVNGAVITLSFPEFNISKKAVTSGTGGFSARINAPYSTGNFLLNIKADKEPYSSVNDSRVIRVIRSKELAITGVSDIERVNLNKTLNLTLTLMNTGQTNFTKPIYLEVNGIPNDWYSLSPASIDSLDVNEKRDVSLKIRITPEHCASGCKKYNLVNFVAKSEEITRSISFSLEIIVPHAKQLNQTEEKEEKGGMIGFITFPRFTMPSITSPYLSLTIIVILLILIVNKKKARKSIKKSIRKTGMILYDKRRRTTRKGSGLLSMGKNKALNFRSDVIHQLHKAKSEIGGESKSNK